MDVFELRERLEALRATSQESVELFSAQLDILESAVEQMITSQPVAPAPRGDVSDSLRLSPEDEYFLEYEL